jgi:hypothetical protein
MRDDGFVSVRCGQPTDIMDFHHHSIRENLSAWITGLEPNWSLLTHATAHLWESKGTGLIFDAAVAAASGNCKRCFVHSLYRRPLMSMCSAKLPNDRFLLQWYLAVARESSKLQDGDHRCARFPSNRLRFFAMYDRRGDDAKCEYLVPRPGTFGRDTTRRKNISYTICVHSPHQECLRPRKSMELERVFESFVLAFELLNYLPIS